MNLAVEAAEAGATWGLSRLAGLREKAGDREGARALILRAADAGDMTGPVLLQILAPGTELLPRYGLNPDGTPAAPWSIASLRHFGNAAGRLTPLQSSTDSTST